MRKYSIKDLSDLTGVSQYVIRAWEKRYHALNPKRSDTGRRSYLEEDVERLRLLAELVGKDVPIRKIASLSSTQLTEMVLRMNEKFSECNEWDEYLEKFDLKSLDLYLRKVKKQLDNAEFCLNICLPIMNQVGVYYLRSQYIVAQEHSVSSLIRAHLFEILFSVDHEEQLSESKLVITTSFDGDYHEIGTLIASILLRSKGYRVNYLGASMPWDSLVSFCQQMQPDLLVISSSSLPDSMLPIDKKIFMQNIAVKIGKECKIIAGLSKDLEKVKIKNVEILSNLKDLILTDL